MNETSGWPGGTDEWIVDLEMLGGQITHHRSQHVIQPLFLRMIGCGGGETFM